MPADFGCRIGLATPTTVRHERKGPRRAEGLLMPVRPTGADEKSPTPNPLFIHLQAGGTSMRRNDGHRLCQPTLRIVGTSPPPPGSSGSSFTGIAGSQFTRITRFSGSLFGPVQNECQCARRMCARGLACVPPFEDVEVRSTACCRAGPMRYPTSHSVAFEGGKRRGPLLVFVGTGLAGWRLWPDASRNSTLTLARYSTRLINGARSWSFDRSCGSAIISSRNLPALLSCRMWTAHARQLSSSAAPWCNAAMHARPAP